MGLVIDAYHEGLQVGTVEKGLRIAGFGYGSSILNSEFEHEEFEREGYCKVFTNEADVEESEGGIPLEYVEVFCDLDNSMVYVTKIVTEPSESEAVYKFEITDALLADVWQADSPEPFLEWLDEKLSSI